MLAYFTCDRIGSETGGGVVTFNESKALKSLGNFKLFNPNPTNNPFEADNLICNQDFSGIKLAHFYSGTFSQTVKNLKSQGTKVVYTAAAHDPELSKQEFEGLGMAYDIPHMTNKDLFDKYVEGYLLADLVICPSTHSESIMKKFGCKNTKVIPHGIYPNHGKLKERPKNFTVGYLGQIGPDKGIRYLIEAWAKLNYKDSILYLAGSQSPELIHYIRYFKKGNYNILGWVKNIEEFYNSISLYVQPSVTEGFGIEVLEAMSFGRPVVCSNGAGAADCIDKCGMAVPKRSADMLAYAIDKYKTSTLPSQEECVNNAKKYSWDIVAEQYKTEWNNILGAV